MAQCFSLTLPDVNMSIQSSLEPGQSKKKAQSLGITFPWGKKLRCKWMDMHTPKQPYAFPFFIFDNTAIIT